MKNALSTWAFILIIASCISCKKDAQRDYKTSSIIVINSIQDAQNIAVNFLDTPIPFHLNRALIQYGSSIEYGITAGRTPLNIISAGDTSKPLISGSIDLKAGGIYSLYLAGQNGKAVDTVFMQDTIPVYADSSAGIRFINCSADNRPLTVNLLGNDPSQTEVAGLFYKQISAFKPYDARIIGGSYTFEIRDPALPDPIAMFSWNYMPGKNYTVVISGSQSSGILVFQVNNF